MLITFTLHSGEKLKFNTDKTSIIIGRSLSCDIVLPFENISRQHCKIDFRDGEFYITDLGSVNGIFVEGNRLIPSEPTCFNTYLGLAFGEVSNMELVNDSPEPSLILAIKNPNNLLQTEKYNDAGHKKKRIDLKSRKNKKEARKFKLSLLNVVGVLILILASLYYFNNEETEYLQEPDENEITMEII
jgi:pSer/pThr/pTyr-binding forkhead associated (FHA) protein